MGEQREGVREGIENIKQEKLSEKLKPYIYCIFANVCLAGFNIISKIYLNKGMSLYVLVTYGQAIGALTTALLAFLFERLYTLLSFSVFFYLLVALHNVMTNKDRGKKIKTKKNCISQVISFYNSVTMF